MNQNSNPTGNPRVHPTTSNVRVPGAGEQQDSGDRVRGHDPKRVSLAPLNPVAALKGLLATPPPADDEGAK